MRYLILPGVLISLLIAYALWWFALAGQFEDRLAEVRSMQHPVEADFTLEGVSGFPYRLSADLTDVTLSDGAGRWTWSAPGLSILLQPWNPDSAIVDLEGPQIVRAILGQQTLQTRVEAVSAMVSAARAGQGLGDFTADYREVRISDAAGHIADVDRVQAKTFVPNEAAAKPGLRAGVSLDGIDVAVPRLPSSFPMNGDVQLARALLRFEGLTRPGELATLEQRFRAGRPVSAEILDLAVKWGDLDLTGTGTVALDGSGYPTGSVTLHARGLDETAEKAVRSGLITREQADTLRSAVGVVSLLSGGSRERATVTIVMRERAAWIGPIRIAELAPVF